MIQGSKGSGGGKQRAPVESPDSLISVSNAKIVDLVSEGPIVGLVNGQASVFLTETPAMTNGVPNFSGFQFFERTGTQDQLSIPGFPSSESEFGVNTVVELAKPVLRSVSGQQLSAIRVRLKVPRLTQQNTSNGDTTGYTLPYKIDLQTDGGAWVNVVDNSFTGKTTTGYVRSHRIDLPPRGPWQVRVTRGNQESKVDAIQDSLLVEAVTEVIDAKFRYPNSALIGTQFDASQFSDIPSRAFDMMGRIIRVPSNYDAETRTYSGIWDGTFKSSYTNNPAWVYYDLLLNARYGLGDRIKAENVNKWALYQIAQYCDVMVPDGKGGQEPQFTCNLYLQSRQDALRTLQEVASIFRGMAFWGNNEAVVTADMPADPIRSYANSDVVGGTFSYKGSGGISRYNVALVTWNDMSDFGRKKVEYVEDRDEIARQGKINKIELTATGCTSQGQAQRNGRYALLTNNLEEDAVTFSVGLQGAVVRPGNIIRVFDKDIAGLRTGGRVSEATLRSVMTDDVGEAAVGDSITLVLPNLISQTRIITAIDGNKVSWTDSLDAVPVFGSTWGYESARVAAQLFRVATVSETSTKFVYQINATRHVPQKYNAINANTRIELPPISVLPDGLQAAPTNVALTSTYAIEQTMAVSTMTVTWEPAPGAVMYEVQWRRSDSNWIFGGQTGTCEMDIQGIYTGQYLARVRALSAMDNGSNWTSSPLTNLIGKTGTPPALAFISATGITMGMVVNWGFPAGAGDTAFTEIEYGTANTPENMLKLGDFAYPTDTHTLLNQKSGVRLFFRGRIRDRTGNVGPWSDIVSGLTQNSADVLLDYVKGQIDESALTPALNGRIDLIDGDGPGSVNDRIKDITDALLYDPTKAYVKNDVVRFGQNLFQAEGPVAVGVAPPSPPWKNVGTILEEANALAGEVHQNTLDITRVDGRVTAQSERIDGVYAEITGPMAGSENDLAGSTGGYAGVWSIQSAVTDGDYAQAKLTQSLEAQVGNNYADYVQTTTALTNQQTATSSQLTTLRSDFEDNKSTVQTQIKTVSDQSSATAQQTTQLQTTVNGHTQQFQQQATINQNVDGKITGTYAVRFALQANGQPYATGFGLSIETGTNGVPTSQFVVQADRFAVYNGNLGSGSVPFAVEGTETYIKSAFIQNASITMLKIGDNLQSDNYVAGQTGWKMGKAGLMENNGTGNGYRVTQSNTYWRLYVDGMSLPLVELGVLIG